MRATDLMVGDWVQNPLGYKAQVLDIRYIKDEGDGYGGGYRVNIGTNDWGCVQWLEEKDIEPIPLTPKILEKNGFLVKHPDSEKRQYWRDRAGQIVVHKNRGYFFFSISGNAFKFGFYVPHFSSHIRYVHELQHALKLCGIEKEIEL